MHVLGTAGHVDHGKSSLVRALTGTNPDRWAEEQRRGMTLDLGFAHLRFPDGLEAGIVDVPGHERFLHNMLAGAAGMEVLVVVVSSVEGPRPQTLEHLTIAGYLNVERTIVAMTKCDLAGAEERAFAEDLAREALAGTIAHGAPYVSVSSVTGEGLDALRDEIHAALRSLAPRAPHAPAYLPIDRVFSLAGHGTVVTGTLMQGRIATGDALVLAPLGREVRARSVHVFGERRTEADGGSRVAVNLPGLETSEIGRGTVLADPRLRTATTLAVRFRPLPHAFALLRRRTVVRVYLGSAEILATLAFASAPVEPLWPGAALDATLHLREPAIAIPGATFVVRRLTPKVLLGGGTIAALGADPDGTSGEASVAPGDGSPEAARVLAALHAADLAGLASEAVAAAANLLATRAALVLDELERDGLVVRLARPVAFAHADLAEALFARARTLLEAAERERPWTPGTTSLALARQLGVREATVVRVLATFVEDGRLAYGGGYYTTPAYEPRLTSEQNGLFETACAVRAEAPHVPAASAEIAARMKASGVEGIEAAYQTLLSRGSLVRIGDDVYTATQIDAIRTRCEALLRASERATPAQFRDAIGTSRKYVVPLLEYFDASGFTIRTGDARVLRGERSTRP